ncbi:energy-coupling factor transporter transmembrane component T family protein [Gardnerella vaginalis]|uniref:Energy-coupling factor transporter transmembrane protein EcfT n=1 Tax=Gardnerella vaginalis TaxID=2702 RepID=A0A2K1STK7_GARVA|nr:energy-coupling factor transporter transmembrane component T [Gardnerella vaginalis]PNS42828.1 energy-coupling factor transporter transmembrane protein EcfT [Gardnerella vaginalis]
MKTRLLTYQSGNTFLHRANPIAKLILAASIVISVFIAKQYSVLIALAVIIFVVMAFTHVTKTLFGLVKAMLVISCIMFFLQTVIAQSGNYIFLWFTLKGIDIGAKSSLRLFCFAFPLVTVLTVTKLNDLANSIVQYLHIPYCYAFTITTAVRFVPIFAQEMSSISEAQTARGVEFDTKNPFKKLILMAPLIIPLVITSVRKADSCALAAEQRGFYLRNSKSSYYKYPFGWRDLIIFVISVLIIAAPILISCFAPYIV